MMLPAKLSAPMSDESMIVIVWSGGSPGSPPGREFEELGGRDHRGRAAAGAVEERDHLRHRRHLTARAE